MYDNNMDSGSVYNFKCVIDNPQALLLLISKYAKFNLIKNTVFKGFIYSIDPVTHSVILLIPQKHKHGLFQRVLIPGHAIVDITEESPEDSMKMPVIVSSVSNNKSIEEKKKRLMEWFKTNLLTITECEDNILFGNVTILPPYNTEDICTDNPIIATQVKKVMESMPEDFNPQCTTKISI